MKKNVKEFVINLKNGLKMVIRKYGYRGLNGALTMSSLVFAYYVGESKVTKFTAITFRDLAQKLNVPADKLAYFLKYDITSPTVRGNLALD